MNKAYTPLNIGDPAPDFNLPDAQGRLHCLADYRGHWLVVYFYPKDNTPGCTIEACRLRDDMALFTNADVTVLGISTDNGQSHARFAEKQALPFTLLSDVSGEVSARYGALFKLGPLQFCKRHSFIIDPSGKLAKIYRSVAPGKHSRELLQDLQQLQHG